MSDVNANINISINSQQALGQLRALQNQISTFNQSVVAGNVAAVQAQRDMTRNLTAQINATKGFTTSIANVETSVSRLGTAIDKNKLSLREYFRYGVAASGAMGKGMREHAEIMGLAGERVKRLQTQYIALEQAHNGYTRSLAVRPTNLFNADSAIAIQRQQIFNKLLGDGSTALVNWGKNTQWAGRQLMVGFTVPLTIFGGVAGKIFMDLEKQVVQFKRVYGDLNTPTSERNAMVEQVKGLAKEFTKYGIAVSDTIALAAKAAATGAQGEDLMAATTEATRLATLGQIDYQQALDATISLQTALGISSDELAGATNFLNAVENQTVTSLDDITSAIPLVAPVIKGLGGDVKDLAIFMTAMREGGISANEGANALKSGLASLINPTRGAKEQLEKVGINIDSILSKNKGDLRGLVTEFGEALGTLGKFERQQTLAKMFGKYQFARMGALFSNISKEGSQAARVMDLTAMSAKELGQIAEGELSQLEESVGVKFTAALEKLKLAIAPIGEAFLKIATPIIDFAAKIADAFNNLPDAAKTFITWGTAIGGVLIPTVIMLVGLLGNFAGNMLKIGAAIGRLMGKTTGLGHGFEYLSMEELDAMAAAASLEGQTNSLTGALNVQRGAVSRLAAAYGSYTAAAGAAAANLPQGFRGPVRRMATGGVVPGTGNGDTVPALLTPGESVINKEASKRYAPILEAMNNGTLKGYEQGDIQVGVPGSWEAAHFGGQGKMTGQELIDWSSDKSQAVKERIRQLVDSVEDGVNHVFTTLDNRVTALSRDVNQAVGKTGSGKTVDKSLARRDLVDRGDIAHVELVRQLKSAKIPVEEIKGIVGRLTSEIATGFDDLGDITTVTAEDIDRITNEAYKKVAAADDRVDAAYTKMKDVTTVVDPTARGGRQERVNLEGTYKAKRKTYMSQMKEVAQKVIPYNSKGAIRITKDIAEQMGGTRKEVAAAFSTLEDSVKIRLSSLVGDVKEFSTVMAAELEASGVTLAEAALKGQRKGFKSSSPSEASAEIGDDVPRGTAIGIERSTPVAVAAAADMSNEIKGQLAMDFEDGGLFPEDDFVGKRKLTNEPRRKPTPADYTEAYLMNEEFNAQRLRESVVQRGSRINPTGIDMDDASEQATRASMEATGKKTKEMGDDLDNTNKGIKGFGGKLMGGMMAMDGLLFGMSMMENSVGEFAQKIMPAAFALQGLSMMLPMLTNPFGIAIAAVAAVGIGLWKLNDNMNEVREKGQDLADAMTLSADEIRSTSEFYGKKTIEDKEFEDERKKRTGVTSASAKKAQEYIATDFGQTILRETENAINMVGQGQAVAGLANKLSRMVMSGAINSKQASAIANSISEAMGSETFDVQVIGKLNELIGPNGQDILSSPMRIAIDLAEESQGQVETFANSLQDSIDNVYKQINSRTGEQGSTLTGFQAMGMAMSETGIPGLSWLGERLANTNVDIQQLTISAEAFGKSVGNVAKSDFQLLEDAIQRNKDYMKNLPKDVGEGKRKQIRQQQIKEEDELRKKILSNQKAAQKTFSDLSKKNETATRSVLSGLGSAISETFKDPMLKSMSEAIFGRAGAISKDIQFNVGVSLSTGELSPFAVQSLLDTFGNDEEAFTTMNLLINTVGIKDANDVLSQISALEDDDLRKELSVIVDNRSAKGIEIITAGLAGINGLPNNIRKGVSAFTTGEEDVTRIGRAVQQFDDLPEKKKKSRSVEYWHENFNMVKSAAEYFASLSPSQRKDYLVTYTVLFDEQGSLSAAGWAAVQDSVKDLGAGGAPLGGYVTNDEDASKDTALALAKGTVETTTTEKTTQTGSNPTGTDGSSSGGDKEKSWLEQQIENLSALEKLYTTAGKNGSKLVKQKGNFFGIMDKLRTGQRGKFGKGKAPTIPQFILDTIGDGPEGLKNAMALMNLSEKALNKFISLSKRVAVGQFVENKKKELQANKQKGWAKNILEGSGVAFSKEEIDEIIQDQDAINALLSSKGKKRQEVLKLIREGLDAVGEEEFDYEGQMSRAIEIMDDAFDKQQDLIEKKHQTIIDGYEDQIKANDKLIDGHQQLVDSKQEEIDDYERLNDLDQQKIEDYNRQIELEQRRIESLRREDEIRQRAADALQRELDLLGRAEQTIRDAYQKRIDALDAVAKLNERILQSQQDQLGVAKALSEGDVYAAAQAAAEMQKNSVQFAADQNRAALDQGMENQIGDLRTAGGMTRAQAEAQIQAIQDQSYQVSLQIRDIEDYIYNLKQTKILPLEDAMYERNLTIRDLQNEIYNINELLIEPLENQNESYKRSVDLQQELMDKELEGLIIGGFTLEQWNARKQEMQDTVAAAEDVKLKLAEIAGQYDEIAKKAQAAANAAAGLSAPAAPAPTGGTGSSLNSQMAASLGIENPFGFAWNTGGRIMKYAAGSVVGAGGGDKVSAMLSPGEFVIRKAMVDKYGLPLFEDINQGSFSMPKYGGFGKQVAGVASGGKANIDATIAPVYNTYSVNVNANTNANADDIANTVINRIRSIDSMSVRRINGY